MFMFDRSLRLSRKRKTAAAAKVLNAMEITPWGTYQS